MSKKFILQVDGGGILGLTAAMVLNQLENECKINLRSENFKLKDTLSLCCGTSTGAIIAAMVAAGVDAKVIERFYTNEGPDLFRNSKNSFITRIIKPRYKREAFVETFKDIIETHSPLKNREATIGELATLEGGNPVFMATAFNLLSNRTHFIRTDDDDEKGFKLHDVITWSALSAALYFGSVKMPEFKWSYSENQAHEWSADKNPPSKRNQGAIFQDGGQGTQNSTLGYVLVEAMAKGWIPNADDIVIISLGTGNITPKRYYEDLSNVSKWKEVYLYLTQSRSESLPLQLYAAQYVARSKFNKISLFRLDYESDKNRNLDDVAPEDIAYYQEQGRKIIASAAFKDLVTLVVNQSI